MSFFKIGLVGGNILPSMNILPQKKKLKLVLFTFNFKLAITNISAQLENKEFFSKNYHSLIEILTCAYVYAVSHITRVL